MRKNAPLPSRFPIEHKISFINLHALLECLFIYVLKREVFTEYFLLVLILQIEYSTLDIPYRC